MNVEHRLLRAFEQVDRVEPSTDLWSRVVHSIDEDRAHRRRVVRSIMATVAVLLALVAVGAASVREGVFGTYVDRPVMAALELVGAILVVVVMGPAIGRFGRNYVHDLLPTSTQFAAMFLRLLDVAYYLVFAGYILLTTRFEFELGVAGRPAAPGLAQQLEEAAIRLGGLLLVMGVLHAVTLVVLPLVALVHNSTRQARALPRWMRNIGVLLVVVVIVQFVAAVVAVIVVGAE